MGALRRRNRILGIPLGPRKTDWSRVAGLAAGASGAAAAALGAGVGLRHGRSADAGREEKEQGSGDGEPEKPQESTGGPGEAGGVQEAKEEAVETGEADRTAGAQADSRASEEPEPWGPGEESRPPTGGQDQRGPGGFRMPINALHERYLNLLLGHARQRRHPSHHMLRRFESAITDRPTAEAYFDAIMGEQESRRYPSHHMLERARRIMVRTAVVDELIRLERECGSSRD